MSEYDRLNHTKWECKYHIVFIPKCRPEVLYGKIRQHSGEVFHELARSKDKGGRRIYWAISANSPGSRRDPNPDTASHSAQYMRPFSSFQISTPSSPHHSAINSR
jgi:hypothetical protein